MSEDLIQQQILLAGAYPLPSLYPVLGVNGLLTLIKPGGSACCLLLRLCDQGRVSRGLNLLLTPSSTTTALAATFYRCLSYPSACGMTSIFILKKSVSFGFAFF